MPTKKSKSEHAAAPQSRRDFLASGVRIGGASLAIPALAHAATRTDPSADIGEPQAPAVAPFAIEEATITGLQEILKSGELTARSLAEKYLERIAAVDQRGPAINSIIELNPDALAIADALDAERKSKGSRGPLHGIPLLIKDNIGTADAMMTTAGSLALLGFTPAKDSEVARRLRAAGAVILGKTNLSEWANFRSSHSTSGWSGRGGQTLNPYALDRSPCGSSSGSAAATSANLCVASAGTETDGSIVCPSSGNGLVGIKPTVGLVSRSGIIPISHRQDTAGPMCRSVSDAAILLTAMAGEDPSDAATKTADRKAAHDYTVFLDAAGLRGARIGIVRKSYDFTESTEKILSAALEAMKSEGAVFIDPVEIESLGKFDDSEMDALLYEFKADLNAYLAASAPKVPVHSLREIIEFNERNRERELAWFGQDLFSKAERKGLLTEKGYLDALAKNNRLTRTDGIDAVMDKHRLDALAAITAGPSWMIDLLDGDHDTGGSSSLAAVAGYPNISVPAGFVSGMPVGISFFGRAWSEPTLLKIAYAFENVTRKRTPPRFLPTAELKPIPEIRGDARNDTFSRSRGISL